MRNQTTPTEELLQSMRDLLPKAQFVGVTYTAKKHGETARYTMLINGSYQTYLQKKITECEIQLQNPKLSNIEKMAWAELKASFELSLDRHKQGLQHPDYTKAGQYWHLGNGVQMNTKEQTLEITGEQHAKKVLVPGEYKQVNHRNDLTKAKAEIQRKLPKWRTLCIDPDTLHSVRLNGQTIELD